MPNSIIDFPFEYKHITGDTQVSAHPGVLHTVTINGPSTTAGVLTLYDSLTETGTVIAAITIGKKDESQGISCLIFDVAFTTGLYAGFDGTLAGADITISYK
ncbi:MAG: hypothetical protein PHU08_00215 [Dehalococcoidales bacterium]|nr:hypothetical protein [Dehalococcoidales bacterium]